MASVTPARDHEGGGFAFGPSVPTRRRPPLLEGDTYVWEVAVKKARSFLLLLLLAAFTIRVLWLAVEPLVPYVVSTLAIVLVLGCIYHRMTRW